MRRLQQLPVRGVTGRYRASMTPLPLFPRSQSQPPFSPSETAASARDNVTLPNQ